MSSAQLAYAQAAPVPAPNDLVMQHAELVKRLAYHLVARLPSSVDVDDLIQSGMIGLLDAAKGYDASHGASFETYASIRIRGAMIDEIRRCDWAPRSVHRKLREVSKAIRLVEQEIGSEARAADVAAKMGVPLDEYYQIVSDASRCQVFSINYETDDEDQSRDAADPSCGPDGLLEREEFRDALAGSIVDLPERERLVMALYYQEELNLKEIGAVLEVSESRVCQIHGQALARLRARLGEFLEGGS